MRSIILVLFIVIITVEAVHRTQIDLVLEGLSDQQWTQGERSCFEQTVFVLNNAKNYTVWAMWIWNSMQYPVGIFYGSPYSLGHYDQCLQAPTKTGLVNTQYCLADVKLTLTKYKYEDRNVMGDTEAFLGTNTDMNRDLSKVTWGICLPAVCKHESAVKILKTLNHVNPVMSAEPSVEIEYCQVAGAKREFSNGFHAFMILIALLISTAVFSTIYMQVANPRTRTTHLAKCFCLRNNFLSLTKRAADDDISTLNFIKAAFATIAVISHALSFRMEGPLANVPYADWVISVGATDYIVKNIVKNFPFFLETFFIMSGILLIRLMTKKKHPLTLLICRYFRLMGTFALVTFYIATISIHTGDGPLWQKLAGREQKASLDSWLWSLLMLNNYINRENITQVVAWHIPCDYQLAIMATIVFMLWQKNNRIGMTVTIIISVLSIAIPTFVTYWMKLPGVLFINDIEKITNLRRNEVYLETHIKSYNRMMPYLMGMGMGYIMTVYKPAKHRKSLSKELSLVILAVTYVVLFIAVIAPSCNKQDFGAAVYTTCQKLAISLASCAFIGVIEYGTIPYMKRLTEFHGYTVLSRLTYGMYLTHSMIIQQHAYSRKYIQEFGFISEMTYIIGAVCLTVAVSVLLWLFLEAPLNNLVNLITTRSHRTSEKVDTETDFEQTAFSKIVEFVIGYVDKIKRI